jgi:Carboxypeptidase regulatory-like domain/TonB dependent receptor-like, beta-barrel
MTRNTSIAAIISMFIVAAPAAAQEQRGAIQGFVKDSSGAVLPGVTVDARSPALVGGATASTDSEGGYRFPSLPPGVYEVTASLQGFNPAKTSGVRVELGQILKIDLTLAVAGVAETVQVRAEAPIIDVKQNAAGTNVQADVIERIPKGRDYTTLVLSAPGIDNESRNRGIQIDGASGADNRFFIDGVDQTDLRQGTSLTINSTGKAVANDFVEQVQVKASGYNAEYRAAIGGVISAVTKSGGNQWRGSGGVYFTSDKLQGAVRPTLQLNPSNQREAQYVNAPPDAFRNGEGVFDVGGPVLHDRLWFYLGYNPQSTKTTRTVTFRSNQQRAGFQSAPLDQIANYNVTGQMTTNLRGKFAVSNERVRGGYTLPNIQTDGTSTDNPALFPSPNRRDSFKDSYSAVFDWVLTPHAYANLTANYLRYGGQDVGTFSSALRHTFSGSNFQFADIPTSLRNVSGYADFPSSSRQVRDTFGRYNVNADLTRYLTWRGQHMIKAGIQFEHLTNSVLSGQQAPTIQLFWDASYATVDGRRVRGTYGYYVDTRSFTQGDVKANNTSLFAQDAWTLNNRLTVNLGIRAENEDVPSYRSENPSIHFGLSEKIAPRIGFAWDPRGDSQWKVYGSWGKFYDLLKLTIGRVMFGADRWVNYYYTLDTFNWPSINCDYPPTSGPNCPGTFIALFDNRSVANDPSFNLVDPNLRPTQTEEFTLGADHELRKSMSVGVRYVHKWADYVIESVCQFVPTGEACGVNNPGYGTIGKHPFADGPDQPKPVRNYDALEFRLRKRYANRWSLDASYLLSRLWGNWSGVASSDEAVGCLQPNSCLAFNFLYYSYDASGRPSNGILGTDRPHQVKVQGTYDLPWGTQVGANYLLESGLPLSTIMKERSDGTNFFPYGRGNLGRTPVFSHTDLLLQQEMRIPGRRMRVLVGANVLNLFDQKIVTSMFTTPYRDAFSVPNVQFFAGFDPKAIAAATPSIRPDPRVNLANGYQTRRALTVQAKVMF